MQRINQTEAKNALHFFGSDRTDPAHCQLMVRYHSEIPAVEHDGEYMTYGDQFDATAAGASCSDPAYIWFHALALRMLEYELERRFEGVVSQLLLPSDEDSRPTHEGLAN